MSEQIDKLVDTEMEANYWPKKGKDSRYYGPEATTKSLAKYTRSIIDECAKFIDALPSDVEASGDNLKKHFGIK